MKNYSIIIKMSSKLSIVELKALLSKFKKENKVKITGINNMNKQQLIDECNKYKLLEDTTTGTSELLDIEYDKYSKKHLIVDIQIFFLKQNKTIENLEKLSKEQLISFIAQFNIPHNSPKELENLLNECTKVNQLRDIIKANYVKYGKINIADHNIDNMSSEELEKFIDEYQLMREIESYEFVDNIAMRLIAVYYMYCEFKNKECDVEKKNIPYILEKLKTICDTTSSS